MNGSDMATRKAAARKAAFARRKAAYDPAAGQMACNHLLEYLKPHFSRAVAGYMPIRTEIDPIPAMTELSRSGPVGVPVIRGKGQPLEFHRWKPGAAMAEGPFGARVPENRELVVPEIVILPLVAFDDRGYRLGYGGGFYDRTLAQLRASGPVLALGFAYAGQWADDLPVDATDEPMDALITEKGVTRFER